MIVEIRGDRTSRVWRYDLTRDRVQSAGSGERYKGVATDDGSFALLHKCEKSLLWDDDVERLRNAIEVASRPEIAASPYLCTLLDVQETQATRGEWAYPGTLTAVWEWADSSLHDLLKNRLADLDPPLSGVADEVEANIGAALDAVHGVGLVHLDVAPNNILHIGGAWKLADFDISAPMGTPVGNRGPQHPYRHPDWTTPETSARPEFDLFGLARVHERICSELARPDRG